jgi:aminoglycoside phosphotransferase
MTTALSAPVRDNFRFLWIETGAQVAELRDALDQGSIDLARKVVDRSGYADNLKMRVRDGCIAAIMQTPKSSPDALMLRAVESIASDLERLTRLCRDCVRQYQTLEHTQRKKRRRHAALLSHVEQGLQLIEQAADESDTAIAVKAIKIKSRIDEDYQKLIRSCNADLRNRKDPSVVIASIFMAQRIEEMGTIIQDMGDAIISANMGQQLTADRYRSLSATVKHLRGKRKADGITIEPLAQTRSGSAISGVADVGADDDSYIAVFKDGKRRKLKEEREKVDRWNAIYPGLAPKILSFYKKQDQAALLVEHLPGQTFEQILLQDDPAMLDEAFKALKKTLRAVWRKTHAKKPVAANYMTQLAKRMDTVTNIHADFKDDGCTIAGHAVLPFDALIKACAAREAKLKNPYTVHIHGDFNFDNIIYDAQTRAIRFIDLHRSADMDFLQDVSVFMVSGYRLQALDAERRKRVNHVIADFYGFARRFAQKAEDDTFELRLALGLARSFATSTRFILDRSMAQRMMARARFLMERVVASDPRKPQDFTATIKDLFID